MNTNLLLPERPTADERLAADPYDLRALAGRMLQAMADDRRPAAQADWKTLRRLRGKTPASTLLEQAVFAHNRKVTACHGIFFLGPVMPAETVARDIRDAMRTCAALLNSPEPALLVNCTEQPLGTFLTYNEFPGFAIVTLPIHSPHYPHRLRRTLFHEVAHCFLTCGCRVLDEGFAVWFAENHSGVATKKVPLPADFPVSRLRELLVAAGKDGALFEGAGLTADEAIKMRRLAADLVGELIERHQIAGLRQWFERIQEVTAVEEIPALVTEALGRRLEEFLAVAPAAPESSDDELAVEATRVLMRAWRDRNRDELAGMLGTLEKRAHRSPRLIDAMLNLRIADAAILISGKAKPDDAQIAAIDALLSEAASAGLNSGRLFTLRAKRADLAVRLAGANLIKVINSSQQALHWYAKAFRENPTDPDLLIHYGIHEAHVPAQFGGGRDKGLNLIRKAADDQLWGQWARQLIADFDIDIAPTPPPAPAAKPAPVPAPAITPVATTAAASPPIPAPTTPEPAPAPPREVIVQVSGISVRVSKEFELTLGELTVRAGERIALVGHNGAGKSVLIETLLALRVPGAGSVSLLGEDVSQLRQRPEQRRRVGAFLPRVNFSGLIRVEELVRTHEVVYRTKNPELLRTLGLDELLAKPFRTLSKGQKQRMKLFLALAHRPRIVLLDEPTVGLDEHYARALREYWSGPALKDSALLVASHIPADIATAHRAVCLRQGKQFDAGEISTLIQRHVGHVRGRLRLPLADAARAELEKLDGLVRPPAETNGSLVVFGRPNFERQFVAFLERHAIAAFSLEPCSTEDFLAHLATKESP